MDRLPVWKTSRDAMALVTGSIGTLVRIGGIVLAGVLVLDVVAVVATGLGMGRFLEHAPDILAEMETMEGAGLADPMAMADQLNALMAPGGRLMMLANLAQIVALLGTALLCVTWSRFFVTGARPTGGWWRVPLGSAEIEMIGVLILLLLGHIMAALVTVVVSVALALVWAPAGYVAMCLIYVPAFVVLLRFSLLVPHVACDGGIDPAAVWRMSRGQTWPIFGVLGVVSLAGALLVLLAAAPFFLAGYLHGDLNGTMILIGMLGWIVNMGASGIALTLVLAGAAVMYARLRPPAPTGMTKGAGPG
jgi:hypothetical protein